MYVNTSWKSNTEIIFCVSLLWMKNIRIFTPVCLNTYDLVVNVSLEECRFLKVDPSAPGKQERGW